MDIFIRLHEKRDWKKYKKDWAPRCFAAAALLPVSAFGLGPPRPYGPQGRVRAAPRSNAASSPAWRRAEV